MEGKRGNFAVHKRKNKSHGSIHVRACFEEVECSSFQWWKQPQLCMGANFGKFCRGKQLQLKQEDMELGRRSVRRWMQGNGTQR